MSEVLPRLAPALLVAALLTSPVTAQTGRLPIETRPGDELGHALATDGMRLAVSAPGAERVGLVHLLERSEDSWRVVSTLRPPRGQSWFFGRTVALAPAFVAVGDPNAAHGGLPDSGAVHVWDLAARGAGRPTSLRAPDPRIADLFGSAIALGDGRLFVSAIGRNGAGERDGVVFVYAREANEWRRLGALVSPDPTYDGRFGGTLAVRDHLLLVGDGHGRTYEYAIPDSRTALPVPRGRIDTDAAPRLTPFAVLDTATLRSASWGPRGLRLTEWKRSTGGWSPSDLLSEVLEPSPSPGPVAIAALGATSFIGLAEDSSYGRDRGSLLVVRPGESVARMPGPAGAAGTGFGRQLVVAAGRLLVAAGGVDRSGHVYDFDPVALSQPRLLFRPVAERGAKALAVEPDGRIWAGGPDGLARFDGYEWSVHGATEPAEGGLSHRHVLALLLDRAGRLWVGTENGLHRLDRGDGGFRRYDLSEGAGRQFPRESVVAIHEHRDGSVWTGTNGRLFRYLPQEDRFERFLAFGGEALRLDETYISGIAEHPDGALWVLAKNLFENRASLYRIDTERSEVARYALAPEWGQVGPLLIDSEGAFWIKGPGSVVPPDAPERALAPASPPVEGAHWSAREIDGVVWLSHDDGLFRGEAGSERLEPIAVPAGHLDIQASPPAFATASGPGGGLLVGTFDRLYQSVPSAHRVDLPLLIDRIEVLDSGGVRPVSTHRLERLLLGPSDFSVELGYVAVAPGDSERIRYRYRLDPYDRDWVPAGDRRVALYTHLPPDDYAFRVEATLEERGLERKGEAILAIRVDPAFWQTHWFRGLIAAGLLAMAVVVVANRRAQRKRIDAIRLQVAGDLHDDLSTNLSAIALSTRMLRRPDLDEDSSAQLDRIAETARTMVGDVRDIVWLVDPARDTVEDLVLKMRTLAYDLLGDLRLDVELQDQPLVSIDMLQRRHLLLIYKEMLHNVQRHADASAVRIFFGRRGGEVSLEVSDDGCGFEPGRRRPGHGRRSMEQRAARLRGRLVIDSAVGAGTTVRLILPLG